jgi:DNA-binding response OmpR family regulator
VDAAPPRRRAVTQPTVAAERLPLTVLCLDNDPAILDGMRALLSRWGVDCRVALDVAQAEQQLRQGGIDMILADYHLTEDMNGLQALQYLRGVLGDLPPVAMITADGSSELKQRARLLGYPLLHKPVRPAALRALLSARVRRATA